MAVGREIRVLQTKIFPLAVQLTLSIGGIHHPGGGNVYTFFQTSLRLTNKFTANVEVTMISSGPLL